MKSRYLAAAATIAACMAMPVAAHHMAAGVVSDELYEMIEDNLEGSPHLDMDEIGMDEETVAMSVLTVSVPESAAGEATDLILEAISALEDAQMGEMSSSSIDMEVSLPDAGYVTITITTMTEGAGSATSE
jgi:hypothetical protein